MPKHDTKYTITFVAGMAVVFAALLSLAAVLLRGYQEQNRILDQKKNVLKAFGYASLGLPEEDPSAEEIEATYAERVKTIVINPEGDIQFYINTVGEAVDAEGEPLKDAEGNVRTDIDVKAIMNGELDDRLMVYVLSDSEGNPDGYAFPVAGKGLWSTMYGYFALQCDLNTVRGITFYDHGETPGLGGEIDSPSFQGQFPGKEIYNDRGELVSVTVVKGEAANQYSGEALSHYVDGLSGATITSRGVSDMLQDEMKKYQPFIERTRSGGS